jgi:hypothetical protein
MYAKSERAVKARNRGVLRIMHQMLANAPWLADTDRTALRAWSELEMAYQACDAIYLQLATTKLIPIGIIL